MTEVSHKNQLPWGLRRLRRVKPISTDVLEELSKNNHVKSEALLSSPKSDVTPGKLLRLWLRYPWEDYTRIQSREPSFASRKGAYFHKATIRAFPNSGGIQLLQAFSSFRHPNIANVYDVYCYENRIFVASEYLELSLSELDFHAFLFAEWEIATIIVEVLRGSVYLLSKGVSCKELSVSNIRVSINGSIKFVLDLNQYELEASDKSGQPTHALLDLPFLAEIVEEMLLLRYHLSGDEEWSDDAIDFLSCSLSASIEILQKHPFLTQAQSPSKLAPRVRFAIEVLRINKGQLLGSP